MIYTKISMEDIIKWLKDNLDEKRYQHSIGTAECAKKLANKFNLDEEKAYIAGLLHDCAKCFSNEKLLDIIHSHLEVHSEELKSYKTLHAPVSAYVAGENFGVTDSEILSAIRWHTIGKIGMSDFEKIIFLADKIEERTRKDEYSRPIKLALEEENGLDKAMLICCKNTIKSLVDRDLPICYLTVEIYNNFEKAANV